MVSKGLFLALLAVRRRLCVRGGRLHSIGMDKQAKQKFPIGVKQHTSPAKAQEGIPQGGGIELGAQQKRGAKAQKAQAPPNMFFALGIAYHAAICPSVRGSEPPTSTHGLS